MQTVPLLVRRRPQACLLQPDLEPSTHEDTVVHLPIRLTGDFYGREDQIQVTQSARACSYIFSKEVLKTYQFWLLTFWLLTVPPLHSVIKGLLRSI